MVWEDKRIMARSIGVVALFLFVVWVVLAPDAVAAAARSAGHLLEQVVAFLSAVFS